MNWRLIIAVFILAALASLLLLNPMYFGTSEKDLDEIEKQFFLTNTTKVYTEQLKFREQAVREYKKNFNAVYGSNHLDTAFDHPLRKKIEVRYLLPQTKTSFEVPLDNYSIEPAFLIGYDTLKIQYSIDEDKINTIINDQNVQPHDFQNILQYQDYIKIDRSAVYHIRTVGVIIALGVFIFLYFLMTFLIALEEDRDNEVFSDAAVTRFVKRVDESLKSETETVEESLKNLNSEDLRKRYSREIRSFKRDVEELKNKNAEYFIIEKLAAKAEQKMKEVGSRSNLMLITGLIMAFIGVVIFYVTLPINISATPELWKVITMSIRPTLILVFIEAVSWYLLKQHKSLLGDYKYYHSIYNKKINYLASYKLMQQNDQKNILRNLLSLVLLSEEIKHVQESNKDETVVETSDGLLSSLIDKVMSKF